MGFLLPLLTGAALGAALMWDRPLSAVIRSQQWPVRRSFTEGADPAGGDELAKEPLSSWKRTSAFSALTTVAQRSQSVAMLGSTPVAPTKVREGAQDVETAQALRTPA